jgi:hypothetical protein
MRFLRYTTFALIIGGALFVGWRFVSGEPSYSLPTDIPQQQGSSVAEQADPAEEGADAPYVPPLPNSDGNQDVVLLSVPFTAQAPFGKWEDPRQQDGCEEAAALMAVSWARGETFTLAHAEQQIIAISEYEEEQYGGYHDTSAADTIDRIFKGYFGYSNVRLQYGVGADDIKRELAAGNLVVVPTNGKLLGNPYFTPPGPDRHMLVVKGYDPATREFITNDNGTRWGENYRYHEAVLYNAVMDYPTGYHEPMQGVVKAMIVVQPQV